jgi:toxin-antitoxin system PIN domain toxin
MHHRRYAEWLESIANGAELYGLAEPVVAGFLRIVTNPKAFPSPSRLEVAIDFLEALIQGKNAFRVSPSPRHWQLFLDICRDVNARGNLIPDAYLAALAVENRAELITTDTGFRRYPNLSWRHPLGHS